MISLASISNRAIRRERRRNRGMAAANKIPGTAGDAGIIDRWMKRVSGRVGRLNYSPGRWGRVGNVGQAGRNIEPCQVLIAILLVQISTRVGCCFEPT